MNKDKYVFAQLIEFLDNNKCWNQLLAMMFGQLSNRESLRDLIVAFEAHRVKQYHLGLGRKPIAKTTFASANQNRDYRIFEDFAFYMMEQARKKRVTDVFKLKGNVYAFDSKAMKEIPYESESYYIFDRGYNAFKELFKIHQHESFFVVRAKKNLQYKCCTLMDKTQLVDLFERTDFNNVKELDCPLFPELFD
ncbi:DUF4372 domain-containing protein [uncultured Prevotella sp.]|uniref:DUF4372 domain-containing protein n=2 Tax=Prevotellaceae TaxID=171552 RepID=UPI0027EE03AD|nr:DUF4372 domain-containing protein [Leyella stercorea]